jgi:hypothetical protein
VYSERECREIDCLIAEKVFGWVFTWPVSGIHKGDSVPEGFVPIFRGWPTEQHKSDGVIVEVPQYLNREALD